MNKFTLGLMMVVLAGVAQADIPPPSQNREAQVNVSNLEGTAAQVVYNMLPVDAQIEDQLRTRSSQVKVFMEESRLAQIVCHVVSTHDRPLGSVNARSRTSYSCQIERSANGAPLQRYVVTRRMG